MASFREDAPDEDECEHSEGTSEPTEGFEPFIVKVEDIKTAFDECSQNLDYQCVSSLDVARIF